MQIIIRENHLHTELILLIKTRNMKKFMIFAVMALMSTAAQAITFGFVKINEVKQMGNEFYAYAKNGGYVEINALMFQKLSEFDGYYLLNVDGRQLIAAGDEFMVEELKVEKVGITAGKPEVFFNNGTSKVFSKSEWLKAKAGQTVRRLYINTPTWEFENYGTVDANTIVEYHDYVAPTPKLKVSTPIASAPKKIEFKSKVESVSASNATTSNVETAPSTSTGAAPKIKFSIKH